MARPEAVWHGPDSALSIAARDSLATKAVPARIGSQLFQTSHAKFDFGWVHSLPIPDKPCNV